MLALDAGVESSERVGPASPHMLPLSSIACAERESGVMYFVLKEFYTQSWDWRAVRCEVIRHRRNLYPQ